eukprot:g8248.t1
MAPSSSGTRPDKRNDASCIMWNDKMYIYGGASSDQISLSDVWEFNFNANSWTKITTTGANPKRRHHTTVEYNGKMVTWGGWDVTSKNDAYELDLSSKICKSVATGSKPSARHEHTAVRSNGKMIIFGGYSTSATVNYNDAWELDLTTYIWKELSTTGSKPTTRRHHSTAVFNGKMLIFGGYSPPYHRDTWSLDLKTNKWEQLQTTGSPTPNDYPAARSNPSTIAINNQLVLFAGSVTGVHKNDVWVLGLGDLVPLPSIDMCNVIRSNSGFVYEC